MVFDNKSLVSQLLEIIKSGRPLTIHTAAEALNVSSNKAGDLLLRLYNKGLIFRTRQDGLFLYTVDDARETQCFDAMIREIVLATRS